MSRAHMITEMKKKMTVIKYLRNLSFIAVIIPSIGEV
jgi:hypothetical protein